MKRPFLNKTKLIITTCLSLLLTMSPTAHAGSVLIWPLDPVLEHNQKAVALWLENRDDTAAQMQIRVLKWTQEDGKEQLKQQSEVLVSPPFANIEPGKRQLIRLINNAPTPAGTETAYRILIDELPTPGVAPAAKESSGLVFQMRYVIPLFVSGEGVWTKQDHNRPRDLSKASTPILSYRLITQQGKTFLSLKNTGAVHAKITNVTALLGKNKTEWLSGLVGYVLPGATMRFPLPATAINSQHDRIQVMANSLPDPITLEKY